MEQHFLDKQEVIRLLLVSVAAGEHMLLVGPPGTAKSALVRTFAKLIDARYFEYLLTRFTEPNELFGPVDIRAFREGTYTRKTETMLPEAEIVFLDEIFKSNSAILNSLLTILNERKFANGSRIMDVPLLSMFGASNEVPNDDNLAAIFDRFLLRVVSDNLDSYHFHNLIAKGIANEAALLTLPQVAGAYTAALMALYNDKEPRARAASRTATAFGCHVQLLSLVGRRASERDHLIELQGQVQAQPGLRDFYGLFAAAQRVGLGRPTDVAADPRLRADVDAYTAACAQLVGTERLLELVGVMARGVGHMQLAS